METVGGEQPVVTSEARGHLGPNMRDGATSGRHRGGLSLGVKPTGLRHDITKGKRHTGKNPKIRSGDHNRPRTGPGQLGNRVVQQPRPNVRRGEPGQIVGTDDDQREINTGSNSSTHLRREISGPGTGHRVHTERHSMAGGL